MRLPQAAFSACKQRFFIRNKNFLFTLLKLQKTYDIIIAKNLSYFIYERRGTEMNEKFIITISRQYGSGGRLIAKKVAEKHGIDCYDKELIRLAAKESGMSEKVFESMDEKPTNSLLYSLAMGAYAMDGQYVYWNDVAVPLTDKVYQIQTDLIKKLASEKSGVFVGRCADYVLRDYPNCLKVFISDSHENRVNRIVNEYGAEAKKVDDLINKTDKKRSNYYGFHTNLTWGDCSNYDICVKTGSFGMDEAAEMIIDALELKLGRKVRP